MLGRVTAVESPKITELGLAEDTGRNFGAYQRDAMEYLGLTWPQLIELANTYREKNFTVFHEFQDADTYYRQLGAEQLARQVWFHARADCMAQAQLFWNALDTERPAYGLDFGCGSAPIGFEFAHKGHRLDFVDLDGAPAYEFLKWRTAKYGISCGWTWGGPYDYVLMLDSLEHIRDWQSVLGNIIDRMKPGAVILTNYFLLGDNADNVEHISMDHEAVSRFMEDRMLRPICYWIWVKGGIDA